MSATIHYLNPKIEQKKRQEQHEALAEKTRAEHRQNRHTAVVEKIKALYHPEMTDEEICSLFSQEDYPFASEETFEAIQKLMIEVVRESYQESISR